MRFLTRWLPVVLWAALILSASNDAFSAESSGGWFRSVLGRDLPYAVHVAIRKTAHVVEYAVLGLLAWRAQRGFVIPIAMAIAVAVADETMQSFTAARTGLFADVVLDVCAAMFAIAIAHKRWPSPRVAEGGPR